jgi:hypothetical protein
MCAALCHSSRWRHYLTVQADRNGRPVISPTRPQFTGALPASTDGSDAEDERAYVGVRDLACMGIHLVSRKTGRLTNRRATTASHARSAELSNPAIH